MTEGIPRVVITALVAIVISLGTSYFAFARDAVSRADLRNEVNLASPYTLDRHFIRSTLTSLQTRLAALEREEVGEARERGAITARLNELERLIRSLGR